MFICIHLCPPPSFPPKKGRQLQGRGEPPHRTGSGRQRKNFYLLSICGLIFLKPTFARSLLLMVIPILYNNELTHAHAGGFVCVVPPF